MPTQPTQNKNPVEEDEEKIERKASKKLKTNEAETEETGTEIQKSNKRKKEDEKEEQKEEKKGKTENDEKERSKETTTGKDSEDANTKKINIKKSLKETLHLPENYVVKHLIGKGAYGYVYLAYDKKTNKNVAIKKINRLFEDLVDCKRILREITILNRLKSKYVISLYDIVIPTDLLEFDELQIVLEIADSDLKKLFMTPIFLTEEHVKTILYNLLLGEKFIHESGIIHRDLKPANCLLNHDCSVKICDFGLSRSFNIKKDIHVVTDSEEKEENKEPGPHNKKLTKQLTSHVVTRWYRAPELILLEENYTTAIDMWSTGCIFAELLNMIESHVPNPNDRFPIFPGSSCFPLSPNHNYKKVHEKGNKDQLNVIFNVIGTPSEQDLKHIDREDVVNYIKLFPERKGISLREKYSSISDEGIDLLESMLRFNAHERINNTSALDHPYLKDVRKKHLEQLDTKPIVLPFDDWMHLSETELRYVFLKEIQSFHPDLVIPEKFMVHQNSFYNH